MKFHHAGIETTNISESVRFYKALGFKVERELSLQGEELVFLILECGTRLEIVETEERHRSNGANMHIAFEVENIENYLSKKVIKQGGVIEGPTLLENGWKNAFLYGPNREIIELIEPMPEQWVPPDNV
ncbi:VOC family protein [Pseudalkalibacillus caeni]|uniref:VOC family protein n=1 Tax=Exobacillus caeni TaxID=2574798 RepID=A0A5R9F544_9BACL|nr:VOC family protein [Pseudalkalibacillus caeni]TLS34945.1 VOC family protein [Pseudalkalibacillus caeni]